MRFIRAGKDGVYVKAFVLAVAFLSSTAVPVCRAESDSPLATPSQPVALLAEIRADATDAGVIVSWRVAFDAGAAAYRLERLADGGVYTTVGPGAVPADPFADRSTVYQVPDLPGAVGEVRTYRVVAVYVDGTEAVCGPYVLEISGADAAPRVAGPTVSESGGAPSVGGPATQAAGMPGGDSVRVAVQARGLHRLGAADIAAQLADTDDAGVIAAIAATNVAMTHLGADVAWLPDAGGTGIVFYGEAIDSNYTRDNIYDLRIGPGLVMTARPAGAPSSVDTQQTFTCTVAYEEDLGAPLSKFFDPHLDFWLWTYASTTAPRALTFPATGASREASDSGRVTARLHGWRCGTSVTSHYARASVNGSIAGETAWAGCEPAEVGGTFSQSVLSPEGADSVLLLEATSGDLFYIDGYDVTYERYYMAHGDELYFGGESHTGLSVGGFSSTNVLVVDVTDPARPAVVTEPSVIADGGSYRVGLVNDPATNRSYFAALQGPFLAPSLAPAYDSNLRSATNEADYLVIGPGAFAAGVAELAALRESQGLMSRGVDIRDVYDEFNHGLVSPWAIRDFLVYAGTNWARAPTYILLAGNGTYDYRDAKSSGECIIPPVMVVTDAGLVGGDNPLVDFDGNGVPDAAIGRLPVITTNELAAVIDKIQAFEAAGEWRNRVFMVADQFDPAAGDFAGDSDDVSTNVTAYYSVSNVYVGVTHSYGEARSDIGGGFNEGCGIVNYLGHANTDFLGSGPGSVVLHMDDVQSMTNALRPPLLCGMTCLVGRFDLYNHADPALGKAYILAEGAGAAGVWAPAHLAYNSGNSELDAHLFHGIFRENDVRVGDAVSRALLGYADPDTNGVPRCIYPALLNVYSLLGDPAMALAAPGYAYAGWCELHFTEQECGNPLVSGMLADPDLDGVDNLMEFVLNLDPGDGVPVVEFNSGMEEDPQGQTRVTVTFRQRRWMEGVDVAVETCHDLVAGNWQAAAAERSAVSDLDSETLLVTYRLVDPLTHDAPLFVRLRAAHAE